MGIIAGVNQIVSMVAFISYMATGDIKHGILGIYTLLIVLSNQVGWKK